MDIDHVWRGAAYARVDWNAINLAQNPKMEKSTDYADYTDLRG
jgi:hypothetical protein